MAQLREEKALSEERADFVRAVLANELSVKVLWKFLEVEVPDENDRLNNQWWMKTTVGKGWQLKIMKTKQPPEWDMSVLAFAILNCPNLLKGKQKEDAVKEMRDKRNALCHKCPATYAKPEFNQLFIDLDGSYKSLLGESEAQHFCQELENIKAKRIYDERIEAILAKRDEALRNAEEREEEIMRIHTALREDIIKRVEQMKDKTGELKDCIAHAHDLVTDLDFDVDWILDILSHSSLRKGSDVGAGVQADGPEPIQQARVFKEKDLHAILKLTKRASVKWDSIGLALGFEQSSLDIIRADVTVVIQGPQALYKKMLSNWLKWAPPRHPLPTGTALAVALRDDTVEEDTLARDIEKTFGGGPEE